MHQLRVWGQVWAERQERVKERGHRIHAGLIDQVCGISPHPWSIFCYSLYEIVALFSLSLVMHACNLSYTSAHAPLYLRRLLLRNMLVLPPASVSFWNTVFCV
jgi:hypothetical protein